MPWTPVFVPDTYGPRCSQHPFDPYSFTHVHHGLIAYLCFGGSSIWGFVLCVALEIFWEIIENSSFVIDKFRDGASPSYKGDSYINNLGDVISCSTGYILCCIFPWEAMLTYFVTTEVLLILLCRDSGILIVVQLLLQSEVLRRWQNERIKK